MSNHAPPPTNFVFTVEEAALFLKLGRTTVYRLIGTGELKSVTIGRSRRVPLEALTAYVHDLMNPADHSAAA
ncbi:helix-turn-helix domain-containing protein [Embleya hyalina]|uniref:Excisionase n=1 Tax=Embleya hyalina TaxID=516124 RepID=A0A401YR91_9ACTN|nr:helix-turn-helix domain-containing protein [Embleya hyalina]GCD97111.1 excisionase [Embleya hyalina]